MIKGDREHMKLWTALRLSYLTVKPNMHRRKDACFCSVDRQKI